MIQSAASAAARDANLKFKAVTKLERLIELAPEAVLLLVDLQKPQLDIEQLKTSLAQLEGRPRTIAFAQHVYGEILANAQCESIDQVMTRGQFNHQLPSICQSIATSTEN